MAPVVIPEITSLHSSAGVSLTLLKEETCKRPSLQANREQDIIRDTELRALLDGLSQDPKQVPCSYLYDETGSALYNKITELEEYYPYKTELELLHQHAHDIVKTIPVGARVVELGCGSASKTSILQRELLERDGPDNCAFIGIDVSADFLDEARSNMLKACPGLLSSNVEMIEASYLEGLQEARRRHPDDVLCILWLGSSIGNLDHQDSQTFFKDLLRISGPKTQVLVCTDLWKDKSILYSAYHDSLGITEAFIKNGLCNAVQNASGGRVSVNTDTWQYDVVVNPDKHQVEMYVIAGETLAVRPGITFKQGEHVLMEVSRKFLPEQIRQLAYQTGFYYQASWQNKLYSMQVLCSPSLAFQLTWQNTDQIFGRIHDWSAIPISLRHPFCFYYGHVTAFAKIKLFQGEEPSKWDTMFSRGIDPNVCDPSQCHNHPEAPDCWPEKTEIIQYVKEVREKLMLYAQGPGPNMWLINMVLEHECMHQETLCYMLAQNQRKIWEEAHLDGDGSLILQNGIDVEESLAKWTPDSSLHTDIGLSAREENEEKWISVPTGEIVLGAVLDRTKGFGWDNEGPPQAPQVVKAFEVGKRPVTVGEFRTFVLSKGYQNQTLWSKEAYQCIASKGNAPATWTLTADNDLWIHYPEGTWHWSHVRERPVWCSLAEAQAFCRSEGTSLMSEAEYLQALHHSSSENSIKELSCNGWEMTTSPMTALKGFSPMEDYPEYSQDFYDDRHFILRGSSPYTRSVVRPNFRNFYQDVYPYHFAKFRQCRHGEIPQGGQTTV